MRTLIIPCAGQSSRYTTKRPKYFLNHPNGNLMSFESIKGLPLDLFDNIVLVTLKRYIEQENVYDEIQNNFKIFENFKLVILDEDTKSSAETITKAIEELNIEGEIYLKDADDYFEVSNLNPNEVCTFSLNNIKNVTPGNKSYVTKTENGEILTIVEKKVISSDFCCGLYSFKSAKLFVESFRKINMVGEVYISHIIYQMILDGYSFNINEVDNFIDWGTQEDWDKYISEYEK